MRYVLHCEPWKDDEGNDRYLVLAVPEAEAIDDMRRALQQAKPGTIDNRTDAECLEDFIVVHWGCLVEDVKGGAS